MAKLNNDRELTAENGTFYIRVYYICNPCFVNSRLFMLPYCNKVLDREDTQSECTFLAVWSTYTLSEIGEGDLNRVEGFKSVDTSM